MLAIIEVLLLRIAPGTHLSKFMNGSLGIWHLIIAIGIQLEHAIISTVTNLLLFKLWVGRPVFVV